MPTQRDLVAAKCAAINADINRIVKVFNLTAPVREHGGPVENLLATLRLAKSKVEAESFERAKGQFEAEKRKRILAATSRSSEMRETLEAELKSARSREADLERQLEAARAMLRALKAKQRGLLFPWGMFAKRPIQTERPN